MNKKIQSRFRNGITDVFAVIVCILLACSVNGQQKGIVFINTGHWEAIVAQAKVQNKYIFVDCFTTWCGPCRYMSDVIFPTKEVGDFFNKNYISVALQIDSTSKDSPQTKFRYTDASYIKSLYNVEAFPTYLFFSPDGEIVHKIIGGSDATAFIEIGKAAMSPQTQYYTQLKKYQTGQWDNEFLKRLTLLSMESFEDSNRMKFAKEYIRSMPDLIKNSDLIQFVFQTTRNIRDTGFRLMLNNLNAFEHIIGKDQLHISIKTIIFEGESDYNADTWDSWTEQKWLSYSKGLAEKYPAVANEAVDFIKFVVFERTDQWLKFAKIVEKNIRLSTLSKRQLNDYAWSVFKKCDDKVILEKALKWSKNSFQSSGPIEPGFIDTYANLLYKLGKNKKALEWELKAQNIAIEQGAGKDWGEDVIKKIKAHEKTW